MQFVHLCDQLNSMGLHNFESTRILVNCSWNLDELEVLLQNYKDKEIIKFLKYSWPISHDGPTGGKKVPNNWPGAYQNQSVVRKYFERETSQGSVIQSLRCKSIF